METQKMQAFKITPGTWNANDKCEVVSFDGQVILRGIPPKRNNWIMSAEAADNIRLAAEAGNVLNELGLSPRALADCMQDYKAQREEIVAVILQIQEDLRKSLSMGSAGWADTALEKVEKLLAQYKISK